jgi:hypothetical protein
LVVGHWHFVIGQKGIRMNLLQLDWMWIQSVFTAVVQRMRAWLRALRQRLTANRQKPFSGQQPSSGQQPTANSQWLIAIRLLVLFLLIGGLSAGIFAPEDAACAGNCQGCYCDQIINGTCYVSGRPSGCIGCVGSCINPGECQCRAGRGGCGAVVAWCRSSDCQPQPTPAPTATPVLTPTPTPPVCAEGIIDHIEPPLVVDWYHEPDYPTVVGQDSSFRGFDLIIQARGGYAERREVKLVQQCPNGGTDPAACPNAWQWVCDARVLARYDDPIVDIDLPMRLADSSVEWLNDDLRPRYPGASHKEGLPRVFELWNGEAMSVETGLLDYKAQDPGVHGGKIIVTTKGTPLNEPQRLAVPFEVPVYLLDSTLNE